MFKPIAAAGLVLALVGPGIAVAQSQPPAPAQMPVPALQQAAATSMPMHQGMPMYPAMPTAADITYEYIQQAASMQYDGETLTLNGLAPSTIFFSDRPYRVIGQVDAQSFASLWAEPNGTFHTDPPNAAVTVLGSTDKEPAIVELTSVAVEGATVRYGVKVLSGELPDGGENVALFIDRGPGFGGHFGGGMHFAGGDVHFGGGGFGGYHPYHPYYPPYHPYHPYHPYYPPYHPYYPPYHPYYPYYPYYNPGAAFAAGAVGAMAGAAIGSAIAQPSQVYYYPVPTGPVPANCWLNSNHTRMICSVPLNNPPN